MLTTATTITFEVHRHSSSPLTSYQPLPLRYSEENISPVDCASKMYAAHQYQEELRGQALLEHSKRKRKAALSWEERVYESESEVLDAMVSSCCPHCATAFSDFSGCAALQCSTCMRFFCGLCGCGTPDDGHDHVLNCPSRSFFKMNGVFLRIEDWHRGGDGLDESGRVIITLVTEENSCNGAYFSNQKLLSSLKTRLIQAQLQRQGTCEQPEVGRAPMHSPKQP